MISKTVTVGAASGLHARPAARFSQAVANSGIDVDITFQGETVDAASVLELMTLGVGNGDEVTLSTANDADASTLDELVAMLASDLDAD
ncbi:HPr family phosphocarrier protein [Bifidobacterium sp.]|jgi:phosphotransferase system HPr (HPr) family protein|uniref:HPr family phosphocarrier protein n=1 Tax=Bifidobacterium sp. TaxID=41200 RepID=UPI0025C6A5CC|nr:HPr family phosphocarrier protein [Bifidobacterium sp.]MCI1634663.1 HPr family phosphocarrier protein [Bifidobacterium sp.]